MKTPHRRLTFLLAVVALVVTACGDAASEADTTSMSEMGSDYTYGEPADRGDADRVIQVIASDDLAFAPAEITVSPGEVITFHVVNDGQIAHDFTLGDEAAQEEHHDAMAEMPGMAHDEPNVIVLPAGETKELTWRFGDEGSVIFGCHQPGHYDGGMRGLVSIES